MQKDNTLRLAFLALLACLASLAAFNWLLIFPAACCPSYDTCIRFITRSSPINKLPASTSSQLPKQTTSPFRQASRLTD